MRMCMLIAWIIANHRPDPLEWIAQLVVEQRWRVPDLCWLGDMSVRTGRHQMRIGQEVEMDLEMEI